MLDLLISILMMLGIQFTQTGTGQIAISSKDADTLKSSEEFQKSASEGNVSYEDIVILDDIDPSLSSDSHE